MSSKTYYYARVSSTDQALDRQLEAFYSLGADERDIITDKQSGKNLERAGYMALKSTMLRPDDTLVIKSLDRLSRNKMDIKNELQYFKDNNIRLKVIDLPTTMLDLPPEQSWVMDMVNNILIEVLSSIAEQEYHTIHKRQMEGIKAAKNNNVKFGRPPVSKPKNWDSTVLKYKANIISAKQAMEELGLKKTSFYKLLKEKQYVFFGKITYLTSIFFR